MNPGPLDYTGSTEVIDAVFIESDMADVEPPAADSEEAALVAACDSESEA